MQGRTALKSVLVQVLSVPRVLLLVWVFHKSVAVGECSRIMRPRGILLIAERGVRFSGDISKAIAGCKCHMVGGCAAYRLGAGWCVKLFCSGSFI